MSYLFTTAYRTILDRIKKHKPIYSETIKYYEPNHNSQYSDACEILEIALEKLPPNQNLQ